MPGFKNEDYWQDAPGQRQHATDLRITLTRASVSNGLLILCDFFLAAVGLASAADIRRWIDEQYHRGIWIGLIRELDIAAEPDLLPCDFGIYGERLA